MGWHDVKVMVSWSGGASGEGGLTDRRMLPGCGGLEQVMGVAAPGGHAGWVPEYYIRNAGVRGRREGRTRVWRRVRRNPPDGGPGRTAVGIQAVTTGGATLHQGPAVLATFIAAADGHRPSVLVGSYIWTHQGIHSA
jgi:hypothetical protein